MRTTIALLSALLLLSACKTRPDASRLYDKNVYRLRLNPPDGVSGGARCPHDPNIRDIPAIG